MLKQITEIFQGGSLKHKIYAGAFWTLLGFGGQKALQLISNLILTRMLFPEAFGLMAIVNVYIIGVGMLSDIGIKPAIIQMKKSGSQDFLNTAWTLQIIRGLVLWVVLTIIAYPASQIYGEPVLFNLLCFVGFTAIFQGFRSINLHLASKQLQVRKVILTKVLGQIVSVSLMISLALHYKSVWALAIGSVVGGFVEVCLGYILLRGHKHKLAFNRQHVMDILHFGKWIFGSTLCTFFAGHGIRAVEAGFVTAEVMGILSIAVTMAWMLIDLLGQVNSNLVFPALAEVNRGNPGAVAKALAKVRFKLLLVILPAFGLMSLASSFIIDLLYDDRYSLAGPLLAIMALNGAVRTLPSSFQNALLSTGRTRENFFLGISLAVFNVAGTIIGYQLGGLFGMVMGSGVGFLASYMVTIILVSRHGWLQLKYDSVALLTLAAFAVATYHVNLEQHL